MDAYILSHCAALSALIAVLIIVMLYRLKCIQIFIGEDLIIRQIASVHRSIIMEEHIIAGMRLSRGMQGKTQFMKTEHFYELPSRRLAFWLADTFVRESKLSRRRV